MILRQRESRSLPALNKNPGHRKMIGVLFLRAALRVVRIAGMPRPLLRLATHPHFVLAAVILVCGLNVGLQATAPDDVLKAKGLTKSGAYYLLAADAKLPESLRELR